MDRAQDALSRLRAIAGISAHRAVSGMFTLGSDLFGLPGLERGTVHEILTAGKGDGPAAAGFALGLAARAADSKRPSLWVRFAGKKQGIVYGGGLAGMGLDPSTLIHLPVSDEKDALRATLEGLRCKGLGSVIVEIAGPARHLDLTATRRMKLAAAEHGVTALILCHRADPVPSAAETRWRVGASLSASPGLGLPGHPTFSVTLLKHRSHETGRIWDLEWDNETREFTPKTLSRPMVARPSDRTHPAAGEGPRARAG